MSLATDCGFVFYTESSVTSMRPTSSLGNIKLLALFNFFNDFRLFGPILIVYFADVAGSFVLGGAVFSTAMISSALFEIPTGVMSDRLPRTRIAFLGAVATVFAVVAYAVAPGFELLIVGALLEGLGRSLFSGNNDALLWDSLAEHKREQEFHHHLARVNIGFQVALATSAVIGGVVAGWSMRWSVALSILPQLACVAVALLLREPAVRHDIEPVHPLRHIAVAAKNIARHKRLRRLTIARAIGYGAGESGWQFQPSFVALLWPTWAIGIGRGINHATSIAGFWWAGRIIDRFGPTKTLLGSSTIAGVIGLIAFGKPTVLSPALTTLEGAGYGATTTSQNLLVQRWFTDAERATMGSIGQFIASLFFGFMAIAAGWLADAHGPRVALLVCQVVALVALPVYWWLYKTTKDNC